MTRKFSLALLAAALLSVGLIADTSQTYGPLKDSPAFRLRVTFLIVQTAPVILTEATTNSTPPNTYDAGCHTLRANLAAAVARNPDSYTGVFASHLSAHVNITAAGALTGSASAGTLDTPAADSTIFSAIANVWSTVAGCITNP